MRVARVVCTAMGSSVVSTALAALLACSAPNRIADEGDEPFSSECTTGTSTPPSKIEIDLGIYCDSTSIDAEVILEVPASRLNASLPEGLAFALRAGAWRLEGTTPPVRDVGGAFFVDASFDADYETDGEGCTLHHPLRVRLLVDSCDARDTCEPLARAVPIGGFCLPDRIAAGVAFSIGTLPSACISARCNELRPAACKITVDGDRILLDGDDCVRSVSTACEYACSAAGAPCEVPGLAAGRYTIVARNGEATVDVPRAREANAPPECVAGF